MAEIPKRFTLNPKTACKITIRAVAERPGSFIMDERRERILVIEARDAILTERLHLMP
jgi:hypothetical protein